MTTLSQKAKSTVFEFKSDKVANCLVNSQSNGKLVINEKAMETVRKHFHRVASLIGRAGVGKSTLASSIYNLMREDKCEYFEISDDEDSFTKGIWSLNDNLKVLGAKEDCLDILDLEGMVNKDATHYLVVIAMALSNAIVLCTNGETGRGRFNFDALNTIIAGIRIYRKYKINLPPPTIYLQVKSGKNKFTINKQALDREGFISYIKETKCPELKDFDVRLFSIASFNENRFESNYTSSVRAFINDLNKSIIPESKMEEKKESTEHVKDMKFCVENRVKYVKKMVDALNKKSPKMVVQLNFNWFKNEVVQIAAECKSQITVNVKVLAQTVRIDKKVSLKEFCNVFCQANGKMYYGKEVQNRAKLLSFYDANDVQFNNFLHKYTKDLSVDAKVHCKLIYDKQMLVFIRQQKNKGEKLKETNEERFQKTIGKEVLKAINKIKFKGYTSLPYDLKKMIEQERKVLRNEIIEKSKNVMKDYLTGDDLSMDWLSKEWEIKVNWLESLWEEKITEALGSDKQKLTTSGNHTCSNCGKEHGSGVRHKKCGNIALWYWIDNETQYCICDTCREVSRITYVVCWDCDTDLDVEILPMK